MSANQLPPFPVDDATLDMLWAAIHPNELDPDADRTHVYEFYDFMSRLGGSDPTAVEKQWDENTFLMRDQTYEDHAVISSLITEIRRLRAATP